MFLHLILLVSSVLAQDHRCGFIPGPLLKTNSHQKSSTTLKYFRKPTNIRISIHYSSKFRTIQNSRRIKLDIVEPAVQFWMDTLYIKDVWEWSILSPQFCTKNEFYNMKMGDEFIRVCEHNCSTEGFTRKMFFKCYKRSVTGMIQVIGEDGEGIWGSDLAIGVSLDMHCKKGNLAMASSNILDSRSDRPILGFLTLCPNEMNLYNIPMSIDIVKHELAHILAFSTDLYPLFRDDNGWPRTPRNEFGVPRLGKFKTSKYNEIFIPSENTFKIFYENIVTPVGGKTQIFGMLTTPRLVSEARRYFNCSTLSGVLMEDNSNKSDQWSHFEKRLFYTNLMGAEISNRLHVTRFELALMEDSGWYIADYSQATDITFGKNLGCAFTNSSCYDYLKFQKILGESAYPYCNDPNQWHCSKDRMSVHECILLKATDDFPARYRYLDDKTLVSNNSLTDFCPMYPVEKGFSKFENNFIFACSKSPPRPSLLFQIVFDFSYASRCFDSPKDSFWTLESIYASGRPSFGQWGAGCYKYECDERNETLIHIRNKKYLCQRDNQILNVFFIFENSTFFYGYVTCPKYLDLCGKFSRNLKKQTSKLKTNILSKGVYRNVLSKYLATVVILILYTL